MISRSILQEISPWHIQEDVTNRLQRDLMSRQQETRTAEPISQQSPVRPRSIRKKMLSELRPPNTTALIHRVEENRSNLIPRVYKLFEEHTDQQPIKRFSSQKEFTSAKPTNKINICIDVSRVRMNKVQSMQPRFRTRSIKTFHSISQKPEIRPRHHSRRKEHFEDEVYTLKDKIESIFKIRGRQPAFIQQNQDALRRLKNGKLKNIMQPTPLAFQHVNNLHPVFNRRPEMVGTHNGQRRYKLSSDHYLDKLIGRLS